MTIKNKVDLWKRAYNLKQERGPGTFCEVFTQVTHNGGMIARHFMRLRGGSTSKSKRFILTISQKAHLGIWTRRNILSGCVAIFLHCCAVSRWRTNWAMPCSI